MSGATAKTLVGGYEIIDRIATGGMAEIYLARAPQPATGSPYVVIKRILPKFCDDPNFVRMFAEEAKIAASLDHPNIARVYDYGEDDGQPYFTMEYVEGRDLRAIARKRRAKRIPLDVTVAIVMGIAAGLHYAHQRKDADGRPLRIVHRDVTPSNVFLDFAGVPKLIDFGVAKASMKDREETSVGILKGKLAYMSPEQIDQVKDLDGRSDVFALGIILWEMTCYSRLFRSKSPADTIRKICDEDAPRPSRLVKDYPPELERIVMKALARDRDRRYPTARDLQFDLEAFARANRLRTSAARLSQFLRDAFRDELEKEAEALAAQTRETTDSARVHPAHLPLPRDASEQGPQSGSGPMSLFDDSQATSVPQIQRPRPGEIRVEFVPLTDLEAADEADELATLPYDGHLRTADFEEELDQVEAELQRERDDANKRTQRYAIAGITVAAVLAIVVAIVFLG